jgi:hypothetical protein
MKKKYVPAKLEVLMAEAIDVITSSVIVPPEEPGGDTPGGSSSGGSGTGGTYNPDAWAGI